MKRRTGILAYWRVGLFGGTFNPIHIGHIKMVEAARKEYKLSCIYFIPCGIPPHKPKAKMLPAKLRYSLVKSAIKGKKYFKALDLEVKKKKPCYTIDTVKKLIERTGRSTNRRFFFLIGQDEFEKLHTWKKPNELVKLLHFLVLPRAKEGLNKAKKIKLPKLKNLKLSLVHTKIINVSSTEIRNQPK